MLRTSTSLTKEAPTIYRDDQDEHQRNGAELTTDERHLTDTSTNIEKKSPI